jgi:hypothetical protein
MLAVPTNPGFGTNRIFVVDVFDNSNALALPVVRIFDQFVPLLIVYCQVPFAVPSVR